MVETIPDHIFNVKFYGTRGSIPVCDPGFQKYGGNTTCIQVQGPDKQFTGIIDAGTGIRKLGKDLFNQNSAAPKSILIGFTHFHWDHIQGLPFFKPAYSPEFNIHIIALGRDRGIQNLTKIFEVQMQSEYFPIPLKSMDANFDFVLLEKSKELINRTTVTAVKHNHPGGAYSYKLAQHGKKIVISTDIEHGETIDQNIVELARDVDLLIHDAQYTSEELKTHKGWGHSSYDQAIEVAKLANVKQLIMTHHDPNHNDDFLDEMELICRQKFANCSLAKKEWKY